MKDTDLNLETKLCKGKCNNENIKIIYDIDGKLCFYCLKCNEIIKYKINIQKMNDKFIKKRKKKNRDKLNNINKLMQEKNKDIVDNFKKIIKDSKKKKLLKENKKNQEEYVYYKNNYNKLLEKINIQDKQIYTLDVIKNSREIKKYKKNKI